jgi:hypothetical protein
MLSKLGVILLTYGRRPFPADLTDGRRIDYAIWALIGNSVGFLAGPTELLAAGNCGVLSTICEQNLLHHRSHCRYHHHSQSAPSILAQGSIYFTALKQLCARDWCERLSWTRALRTAHLPEVDAMMRSFDKSSNSSIERTRSSHRVVVRSTRRPPKVSAPGLFRK